MTQSDIEASGESEQGYAMFKGPTCTTLQELFAMIKSFSGYPQ